MIKRIREDVRTAFSKDPAAKGTLEVLTCYPGLHAIWCHRLAHRLWNRGFATTARFVSHVSRWLTGIEIHPGATIGRRFFIDHGSGVVIGETTEIGDDVLLYHGCTLGGTSLEATKRHPTLGDNVVVGAGAALLGPIEIGGNSKIGANSVVLESHAPNSTIVGIPAKAVHRSEDEPVMQLEHGDLPDPVFADIERLFDRYDELHCQQDELASLLEHAVANGGLDGAHDLEEPLPAENVDD
ncbi:serine O-acetyltransferase [Natronorubrum sp. JWXQ-INN-674]|uniref:serine O-acetyltransferase n=1 Tax=Natronorubrum halalkaliphilum TaxID=2691917 RepID=A0A6B0VR03_9EURY|nr:serine O-acetyltransferase [Natronorubrum halalkaliphilum]